MRLSEVRPTEALKVLLLHKEIDATIYAFGERPTNLPKEPFIDISYNGNDRCVSIQTGIFESTIFLSINVPLMANDIINKNKQHKYIRDIETIANYVSTVEITGNDDIYVTFDGQRLLYNGDYIVYNDGGRTVRYEYSLNHSTAVVNSKSIVSGYSTYGLNLRCLIYKI